MVYGKNYPMKKIDDCIYHYIYNNEEVPLTIEEIYWKITPTTLKDLKLKNPRCEELTKHEKLYYDKYYEVCDNMTLYKYVYSFDYDGQKYIFYSEHNWKAIRSKFVREKNLEKIVNGKNWSKQNNVPNISGGVPNISGDVPNITTGILILS